MNVNRRSIALSSVVAIAALVAGCSNSGALPSIPTSRPAATAVPATAAPAPATAAPATAAPATVGPATALPSAAAGGCPTSAPPPLPAGQTRTVTIETSQGQIVLKIEGALGPNAAGNFVALAQCGFYNGVVFHRLVPGFVIQGGDPTGTGGGGPGYTIKDEPVKGTYKRGTLAMARTRDPDSQGSQFFIVLDDGAQPALESARTYAIFGEVVSGMETVDKIAAMPNSGDQRGNAALNPVAMTKVTVANP